MGGSVLDGNEKITFDVVHDGNHGTRSLGVVKLSKVELVGTLVIACLPALHNSRQQIQVRSMPLRVVTGSRPDFSLCLLALIRLALKMKSQRR